MTRTPFGRIILSMTAMFCDPWTVAKRNLFRAIVSRQPQLALFCEAHGDSPRAEAWIPFSQSGITAGNPCVSQSHDGSSRRTTARPGTENNPPLGGARLSATDCDAPRGRR